MGKPSANLNGKPGNPSNMTIFDYQKVPSFCSSSWPRASISAFINMAISGMAFLRHFAVVNLGPSSAVRYETGFKAHGLV
jgi:hypothetical protein